MKLSFTDQPELAEGLFDLLDVVFPGVKGGAQEIRALGAPWESVSTPFVHVEGGRVVSHVGVIELPLVIHGEPVMVGAVHAVSTHPDHLRRGHYRRVMEELLADSAGRFGTLVLTTEHPEYFEPFGFRRVRECRFHGTLSSPGGRGGLRRVDPMDPEDNALLHRLLGTREPVSEVLGVVKEKAIFLFNESHRPLHYARDLDALICMEIHEGKLGLFDVVAPKIPSLEEIVSRVPERLRGTAVHFTPDRLGFPLEPVPGLFEHGGPSHFMVRGPFAPEGEPFALPRSART
ncbi:MAG: GNAT family N-acetyltransferase [Candidatus Eisenbacteria bacterium]